MSFLCQGCVSRHGATRRKGDLDEEQGTERMHRAAPCDAYSKRHRAGAEGACRKGIESLEKLSAQTQPETA